MASDVNAADAADEKIDIIGHVLDSGHIEVPFVNAHHILDGRIVLPQFEPIYGIDLSITRHVVVMWVASALLIALLVSAFRRPSLIPRGLANFFEAIVLFIKDEVVQPVMGET